jgi:methyl-accepting chemotaxis protein
MSATMQPAGPISGAPPTPEQRPPRRGFFAHHGIWAPGVRLFRELRFTSKALIISLAFMLPMLGLLGWTLESEADLALQARLNTTRQHVEVVHGLLAWAQAQESVGRLTREQAQQMALRAVAALRYDGSGHFWISDMQPRMLMHPLKPELDGQRLGELKDADGHAPFDAFVATVRNDGKGFVAHRWPEPGNAQARNNVAYVMGFAPWGWILGAAVPVDDLHHGRWREVAWMGGVVASVMLLAAYLFLSFYRVMDGGLRETRRHLRAMTHGDLTTSPSPWGKDESAQLMRELRSMQDSLRGMVLRVRRASGEIVQASQQIANGATDLSARTEHAASALEESAASMEQISATVRSTAEHTEEASRVARHNAAIAADGGRIMREVVDTMEGIRSASAKIGEIVGTIDGIAFQTNILALNAAVEAARAGEQGRGFAVVATEVRMLAQRSAAAAREIKGLIGSSVDQVQAGTTVVRKAGTTIEDIVAASQRVNQLLGEVAIGAREQSTGVAQVGQAVQELDRMTQQNAALVDDTAASAAAMRELAQKLAEEVARFTLPAGSA